MEDSLKDQIEIVARAVREVYPTYKSEFTSPEFCDTVRQLMNTGYVMDQTIMRRLRDFYSDTYQYDKKDKVFRKIESIAA